MKDAAPGIDSRDGPFPHGSTAGIRVTICRSDRQRAVTAERSARIGGFAIGAIVVVVGLVASLELGAWSFNLVTGVLGAMTGHHVTRTATTEINADLVQLRESRSPATRLDAIHRLAQSHDARVLDALRVALRDPDPQVRQAAATALGMLQHRQ